MFQVVSFLQVSTNLNPVCISLLSHTCHMPNQSHSPYLFTRIIFGNTNPEVPHYVTFSIYSASNSWKPTDTRKAYRILVKRLPGKRSDGKTKSRMNVTLAICLGDKMFGKSVFECAPSVLLAAVLMPSVCERCLLQMAQLGPASRSVSRRWIRLAPRHAPSRYSSGLREAQLYCDTATGHTERALWQTDRQTHYMLC